MFLNSIYCDIFFSTLPTSARIVTLHLEVTLSVKRLRSRETLNPSMAITNNVISHRHHWI